MRKAISTQLRIDCLPISQIQLNLNCRDEIVPLLAALQHVYGEVELRNRLVKLIAADVNEMTRHDTGREGFSYWQILVLAVMRLGCNLDYDKLQDLCENHTALRNVMELGDWDQNTGLSSRRIRDTLCLLKPATIELLNREIVAHGQTLHGDARHKVRADSFVIETDIHYPTESSLIWDGVRKIIPLCCNLATLMNASGWRQASHLRDKIKQQTRQIARISASKSPAVKAGTSAAYAELLQRTRGVLDRARALETEAQTLAADMTVSGLCAELTHWLDLTSQVCDTANRRTQLQETVPNSDKLFSLFEPHTQLYRRGKAGEPNQFGRQALVYEDAAGFISHYHLMDRAALDNQVVVAQTRVAQELHAGEIQEASFDRGFYSQENQEQLQEIVAAPCLPPRDPGQYKQWLESVSVEFRRARNHHPGIESAIGALQSGNGLKRCRDRSETGFERYLGLAVLGRNLQTLGKLLICRTSVKLAAGKSKRKAA